MKIRYYGRHSRRARFSNRELYPIEYGDGVVISQLQKEPFLKDLDELSAAGLDVGAIRPYSWEIRNLGEPGTVLKLFV